MQHNSLKFLALSGTTDVTENFYVYEYGDDMIVVDCGVGFPDSDMFGVDLVVPDFSYVVKNKNKLKGIVITHGHEDHLGALPFLLEEVNAPIYSTKLVAGFIQDKFKDYSVKGAKINIFNLENDQVKLGAFTITPFRISHSVPDSAGLAIDTPEGRVYHVPDYKFDWTPVDQKPFDVMKLAKLASEKKTLALASDALGSLSPGYTESEIEIEGRVENIVRNAKEAVLFTTISSNISRMQQAINVAKKTGRKVSFIGRSIDAKAHIARELGYLDFDDSMILSPAKMGGRPRKQRLYIISGSYGQPGSSLQKVSAGEHRFVKVEAGDTVIFSGDPAPPGTKAKVDAVVDNLFELGVDVHYYDLQEDLHVSGHGSQKDIELLFAFLRPKYYIPIGSTVRHMKGYTKIAVKMGADPSQVFELVPGDILELSDGKARKAGNIPVKQMLYDGAEADIGKIVLRDRKILSQDGVVVAIIQIDKQKGTLTQTPDLLSRGFVFEKTKRGMIDNAAKELGEELKTKKNLKRDSVKEIAAHFLDKRFTKEIARRPMIVPVVVEV